MARLHLLSFIIGITLQLHAQTPDTMYYAFLGHIYEWAADGDRVDHRLEAVDLKQFDRIWLGGDVCSEAALDYSTLQYIDNLFDLGKPGNHWTLGNHDTRNGNIEWIMEFTKRPTYYAHAQNGITTIVIDGNISPLDCENLNKQYNLIKNVCDTISNGYLIFLVHHGICTEVPGIPSPNKYSHSTQRNWMANCYNSSSSYIESIYPLLIEAENRGVDVLHITGDVGAGAKSFYAESDDGIEYFGSGINNSYHIQLGNTITDPDLILVFTHILSTNELSWEFVELTSLK